MFTPIGLHQRNYFSEQTGQFTVRYYDGDNEISKTIFELKSAGKTVKPVNPVKATSSYKVKPKPAAQVLQENRQAALKAAINQVVTKEMRHYFND